MSASTEKSKEQWENEKELEFQRSEKRLAQARIYLAQRIFTASEKQINALSAILDTWK